MTEAVREALWAADAWVEIVACRARLRLPGLLGAEPFLRRELAEGSRGPSESEPMERLLSAFRRALRSQPGASGCLARSLALRRFLGRHGYSTRLELGLRKTEGRLRGHAWVEARGSVVSGDAAFVRSFVRLETPRAARRTDG
jgi:hypothetical protein